MVKYADKKLHVYEIQSKLQKMSARPYCSHTRNHVLRVQSDVEIADIKLETFGNDFNLGCNYCKLIIPGIFEFSFPLMALCTPVNAEKESHPPGQPAKVPKANKKLISIILRVYSFRLLIVKARDNDVPPRVFQLQL